MKRILAGLGAVVAALALLAPAAAQTPVVCNDTYTVTAGDWLSKIGEKFYGDLHLFRVIAEQTNRKSETDRTFATIVNPDAIEVGWKLCLPDLSTVAALYGENPAPGLTKTALANATYSSDVVLGGNATLKNGKFSSPAAPDSAALVGMELAGKTAWGDMNGTPSAAVITGSSDGGSGYFYNLSLMQAQDGKPVEVAHTLLGDRTPVLALAIENNVVKVDYLTQGPQDAACCATLRVLESFALEGNALISSARQELRTIGADSATPPATSELTPEASKTPEAITTPEATPEANKPPAELVVKTWEWNGTAYMDTARTVAEPSRYKIVFNADGTAAIQNDCNRMTARYTVDDDAMQITLGVSTLAACPPDSQDAEFSKELSDVVKFGFISDELQLATAELGTMRFREARPTLPPTSESLRGGIWKWQGTTTPTGELKPPDPSRYTVSFLTASEVLIQADCNSGAASYTTVGKALTLGPIALTKIACREGSLDTAFVNDLQKSETYRIEDGKLMIEQRGDGGTLTFRR